MAMKAFRVQTIDKDTGSETWLTVQAFSEEEARDQVVQTGLLVGEIQVDQEPIEIESAIDKIYKKNKSSRRKKVLTVYLFVFVIVVVAAAFGYQKLSAWRQSERENKSLALLEKLEKQMEYSGMHLPPLPNEIEGQMPYPPTGEYDHPYVIETDYNEFDDFTTITLEFDELSITNSTDGFQFTRKFSISNLYIGTKRKYDPGSFTFSISLYEDIGRRINLLVDGARLSLGYSDYGTNRIDSIDLLRMVQANSVRGQISGRFEFEFTPQQMEALRDFASRFDPDSADEPAEERQPTGDIHVGADNGPPPISIDALLRSGDITLSPALVPARLYMRRAFFATKSTRQMDALMQAVTAYCESKTQEPVRQVFVIVGAKRVGTYTDGEWRPEQ